MNPITAPTKGQTLASGSTERGAGLTIDLLLQEQQTLTAVERFARVHEQLENDRRHSLYRELIPLAEPQDGEQYAFEVDLDACSGCKACVSACHHLNGLEESETWRWVGQIHGQALDHNSALPVLQHVTTACHHCVDPGCLNGCPTNAYVKDEKTGIVRHLDDQCFGCQYCTMSCPYQVPQYSAAKGIVRKCDMCHGRLAAGEAPACAQACPSNAIRISIVNVAEVNARSERNAFLPCTPDASITRPTTVYRGADSLPGGSAAAHEEFVTPQHAHFPLVAMLVLTQAGVGAAVLTILLRWIGLMADNTSIAVALGAGLVAMLAGLALAPLHLGRPHLAFRAVLGWRHSWLSREAIGFGLIPPLLGLSIAYAGHEWIDSLASKFVGTGILPPESARPFIEASTIFVCVAGVFCSARIYQVCRREFWIGPRTGLKFALTSVLLGSSTTALVLAACSETASSALKIVLAVQVISGLAQLSYEALIFNKLGAVDTSLRLTAKLLLNDLRPPTIARIFTGISGTLLSMAALILCFWSGTVGPTIVVLTLAGLVLSALAEFFARYLFFAAVIPLRMPGGLK